MTGPDREPEITLVPANEATWGQLQTVFGERGDAARCRCRRTKLGDVQCP
ncbi:hypothetical protein [Catellatospora sp. IY07-71]|nr:hypothetical protein [Catellatospora sp. IY07-71]